MRNWFGLSLAAFLLVAPTGCQSGLGKNPDSKHLSKAERKERAKDEMAKLKNIEGLQACQRGDYETAIGLFTAAAEHEQKPEVYNNLGRALYWSGRYNMALKAYRKAEAMGGRNAALLSNIGDVYRQVGQHDRAMDYYFDALDEQPDLARVHYELGNLYIKRGDYENAIFRINRSLELDPGFNKAMLGRLIAYTLQKQYVKAYEDMRVLERRGYDINKDLRLEVLNGLNAAREETAFRPGD